jgi:GDP-L-fucose synthase
MKIDFFLEKKVLVTGASGFIGTNLVSTLSKLGAQVTGVTYKNKPKLTSKNIKFIQADLTDQSKCFDVCKDIDYVFMCSANSSGAAVMEKTPLVHLTPNVVMNAYMLQAAYANDVKKFCFISSNTVYPVSDKAVSEEDSNFDFFNKYYIVGWMKQFSEVMCEMYSEKISNPMKTIVVRPGNLYGPYDKFTKKESKVIAALIRRAIEKESPFVVWGDGNDIKDFLYIDDFIQALLEVFSHENIGTVNIASGIPVTIKDIVKSIFKALNIDNIEPKYDSSKPTMIPKRMINIDKLLNCIDWKPQTSLDSGIAKTITWYQDKYKSIDPEDEYNSE